jgi:hypothetical protein
LRRLVDETPPNRFNPFEVLDTLDARAEEFVESLGEEDADQVKVLLYALRAYITGMEK